MQFSKIIMSAVLTFFSIVLFGQQTTLLQLEKSDLFVNQEIRLHDAVVDPSSGFITRKNKLRLLYTRSALTDVQGSGDWTYQVYYEIYPYGNQSQSQSHLLELSIDEILNKENYIYESIRVHEGISAQDLVVKILNISTSGTGVVPEDISLFVETETTVHRFLSSSTVGYVHYNSSANEVRWKTIEGAKQYDVEWVFIDEEAIEAFNAFAGASGDAKPFIFKEPIRVRMAGNSLSLKPIYPAGTLYFRVRPVGVWVNGISGDYSHIKTGTWGYTKSATDPTLAKYVISTSFESDKNWQSVVTYAEEGKNKRVVSYYDGSMRNRQSLTNLSTQNVTLAAEQVYDFEGRPAVSLLPSPLNINTFAYQNSLNKKDGNAFSASDFDRQDGVALNTSASNSTAQYYSGNNPFISQQTNGNYIPDASGYVYSQSVYMRDNTGRLAATGGVGSTFKIGGGHETKYFYGTPSAMELYRLFGTNVGNASHYKKNMVKDPNGQLSVSYIDQEGRTIATALAGSGTDNLVNLESNTQDENVTLDLLAGNNGWDLANGVAISTHRQLNVLPNNIYDFEYDITGALFEVAVTGLDPNTPSNTVNFCMDCKYMLTISISDPDGELVNMTFSVPIAQELLKYEDLIEMTETPDCLSSSTYLPEMAPVKFSALFEKIGTYTITRKLEVILDEENFLSQAADVLNQMEITEQGLIDEYLQNVDTVDCDFTCYDRAKTKAKLMYPSYNSTEIDNVIPTIMDTMCIRLLNEAMSGGEVECKDLLNVMKRDVSPNGWMYKGDASSQFWNTVSNNLSLIDFNNEYGTNFTFSDLSDPTQWFEEMSDALVIYHREYCHYEQCSTYAESKSYQFIVSMSAIDWVDAKAKGLDDPFTENATSTVIDKDPIADISFVNVTLTANNGVQKVFYASNTHAEAIEFLMLNAFPGMSSYPNFSTGLDALKGSSVSGMTYPIGDLELWSLFQSAYNAAWLQVFEAVKSDNGCVYYNDGNQLFNAHPDMTDPALWDEIASTSSNFWNSSSEDCEDICAQNTSAWLDDLNTLNNGAIFNNTFGCDSSTIYTYLYEYCIENCGSQNPFGLLLEDSPAFTMLIENITNCDYTLEGLTTFTNYIDGCLEGPYTTSYVSDEFLYIMSLMNQALDSGQSQDYHYNFDENEVSSPFEHLMNYNDAIDITLSIFEEGDGVFDFQHNHCLLIFRDDAGDVITDIIKVIDVTPNFNSPFGNNDNYFGVEWFYANAQVTVQTSSGQRSAFIYINAGDPFSLQDFCFDIVITKTVPCQPYMDTAMFANLDTNRFNLQTAREDCIELIKAEAVQNAKDAWQNLLQDAASLLVAEYNENCLSNTSEKFTAKFDLREYHYTLYYYDQAGNLVQTVPPEGVDRLPNSAFTAGVYNQTSMPVHRLITKYQYNSLNQLVWQSTPDGGETKFWYNSIGQLRFSQNAKQEPDGYFSYTKYDALGRIIEVGEHRKDLLNVTDLNNKTYTTDWPLTKGWEVTTTYYDQPAIAAVQTQFNKPQSNLRSRVSSTAYLENTKGQLEQNNKLTAATHYSYDVHGNVKELVQQQNFWVATPDRYKHMAYDYDLVSGNVKQVAYQAGHYDQFFHRYRYDADNRITRTQTSRDAERWETDARYEYYLHGPLARTVIGEDQVQGVDYAYTLQGWLKAVNGASLVSHYDMGKDGVYSTSGAHKSIATDAFAFNLGYYSSDYSSIGGLNNHILTIVITSDLHGASGQYQNLYNGNIGYMLTAISTTNELEQAVLAKYKYDQLNRLKQSRFARQQDQASALGYAQYWGSTGNSYATDYVYDANGNIKNLKRKDNLGADMDDINYTYNQSNNELINNKLTSVNDIYNGNVGDIIGAHNYTYDNIGNLISDDGEDIDRINWNVYGKIKAVNRNGGGMPNMAFGYGPDGNRMYKVTKGSGTSPGNAQSWVSQWYVRDASGNVMAIYDEKFINAGVNFYESELTLSELPIYGSSRVGLQRGRVDLDKEKVTFAAVSTTSGFEPTNFYVDHLISEAGYFTGTSSGSNVILSTIAESANITIKAKQDQIYFTTNGEVSVSGAYETDEIGDYFTNTEEVDITIYNGGVFTLLDPAGFTANLETEAPVNFNALNLTLVKDVPEKEIYSERKLLLKNYEFSNHLGNVLAVVTDYKIGNDYNVANGNSGTDGIVDVYSPDVISYTDYYPFGMTMPGRNANPGDYRYGFQSQEKDNEIYGEGNAVSFKYRVHDARLGRFLSVDPLFKKYPYNSPYAFQENKLGMGIEFEGLELQQTQKAGGMEISKDENGNSQQAFNEPVSTNSLEPMVRDFSQEKPAQTGPPKPSSSQSAPSMTAQTTPKCVLDQRRLENKNKAMIDDFMEKADPLLFGGQSNNSIGLVPSIYTGIQQAPAVIIPELAVSKAYNSYKKTTLTWNAFRSSKVGIFKGSNHMQKASLGFQTHKNNVSLFNTSLKINLTHANDFNTMIGLYYSIRSNSIDLGSN